MQRFRRILSLRCRGFSASLTAAVVVASLFTAAAAFGCPNCKDAVGTADPEGMNLARGYFYSILLMLAMPLTLVGSFGIYVWREMRRQRLAGSGTGVEGASDPVSRAFISPAAPPSP